MKLAISRLCGLDLVAVNANVLHPRFAASALAAALADAPVVLIHGPRQCGKTTLARGIAESKGYAYCSFDDAVALGAATTDAVGFVADLPEHTILDEVQRVPALFTAIKTTVDQRRRLSRTAQAAGCCGQALCRRRGAVRR